MLYDQKISTNHPGLFLILLDQSLSMKNQITKGISKSVAASKAVNTIIYETILACENDKKIKNRCHLGVIGYSGELATTIFHEDIDKIFELKLSNDDIPIDMQMETIILPNGEQEQMSVESPQWVIPKADGWTPMHLAFEKAKGIVDWWINLPPELLLDKYGIERKIDHRESFPPVIINISDGAPNYPKNAREAAQILKDTKTNNGNCLLWNIHLDEFTSETIPGEKILFPSSKDSLGLICKKDKYVEDDLSEFKMFMYEISSVVPQKLIPNLINIFKNKAKGNESVIPSSESEVPLEISEKSKGFIYGGDVELLIRLLRFGTTL